MPAAHRHQAFSQCKYSCSSARHVMSTREAIRPAQPTVDRSCDARSVRSAIGRVELKSAVRSLMVVVVDVLVQHALEVTPITNDQPVQAFASSTSDPALGVRRWPSEPVVARGSPAYPHPRACARTRRRPSCRCKRSGTWLENPAPGAPP